MSFRAHTALLPMLCSGLLLGGACTSTQPEPEKKAPPTEPVKQVDAPPPVKAATPPPQPTLPLEPSADMKFEPPFDGVAIAESKTANEISIQDFVLGDGPEAVKGGEVEVHYTGYLTDGSVFDTSLKRPRAFTFELGAGRVIKGWDEGVAGMKVGGKRKLVIPAKMGYGERRAGKIPPNSTLVFTIELLSFTPPPPPPQPLTAFEGKAVATKKLDKNLVVMDYKIGDGPEAAIGDTVAVHYRGTLKDGTEFDSSLTRPRPLVFPLGQGRVIKGWDLGIAGMKAGGLRKLTIPAELAYGERARGKIPANADLTFTVELMSIKPAPPATPPATPGTESKVPDVKPGTPGAPLPTKTGVKTETKTETKTEEKRVDTKVGADAATKAK